MAQGPITSMTALIIPLSSSSAPPRPTPPGLPPQPDNTLPGGIPKPEHPIYYPLPPDVPPPQPDQGLPGQQPKPDQGLPGPQPEPGHPIVLPPGGGGWLPVYIWGPTDPRPGTGLPGSQPRPDQGLPGSQPRPDQGLPPIETPDIDLPGEAEWVVGWTPSTGWVSVAIVTPDRPVPTPSKRK